jgi:hypothetical protein
MKYFVAVILAVLSLSTVALAGGFSGPDCRKEFALILTIADAEANGEPEQQEIEGMQAIVVSEQKDKASPDPAALASVRAVVHAVYSKNLTLLEWKAQEDAQCGNK